MRKKVIVQRSEMFRCGRRGGLNLPYGHDGGLLKAKLLQRKSFTLVEVLAVMAIFGMMFGVVFEVLSSGNNSWNFGFTMQDVENQARQGLERIVRETYLTNNGRAFVTGVVDNSILTFQVPVGYDTIDPTTLLWGADGVPDQRIRYSRNAANQLFREVFDAGGSPISASGRILANSVQALNFNLTGSVLTISLTIQKAMINRVPISRTVSSRVRFRN